MAVLGAAFRSNRRYPRFKVRAALAGGKTRQLRAFGFRHGARPVRQIK